jgi:hypothetical protein
MTETAESTARFSALVITQLAYNGQFSLSAVYDDGKKRGIIVDCSLPCKNTSRQG